MSGKATKKDINFKRNERKNQTQFQDPQKIIEMIIILNKTKKTNRWAFGDNFIKGFMNLRATMKSLDDEMLGELITDRLSPGPEPNLPDYNEFKMKNAVIKPEAYNERNTTIEWMTIYLPEYNEYSIDNLPINLKNNIDIAIKSLEPKFRAGFKTYLLDERRRTEKLFDNYQEKIIKLESKFDDRVSRYHKEKDNWESKVKYWRESSVKFMTVINRYWSSDISLEIQKEVNTNGYTQAMENLETSILTSDPEDCNIIRKVAQDYKFRYGTNIVHALRAIDIIYSMVEALGGFTDDIQKKINLIASIKHGSWQMLHKAYELMVAMNMDYDQMKQHLITIYKSWAKTDGDELIEDHDEESTNMVTNDKYRICDICNKFHNGICYFSKDKNEINKPFKGNTKDKEKINISQETNKSSEEENKILKEQI